MEYLIYLDSNWQNKIGNKAWHKYIVQIIEKMKTRETNQIVITL